MIYWIAENRMYALSSRSNGYVEIPSDVLRIYRDHIRQNAERTDWKNSGSGAEFMRAGMPGAFDGADLQQRLDSINAQISTVLLDGDRLLYSLRIDRTGGIYFKERNTVGDGILYSDAAGGFAEFACKNGRLALSCVQGGEAHLGILEKDAKNVTVLTEGSTRESDPSWSRAQEDVIWYTGCGLAQIEPSSMAQRQAMQIIMMSGGQLGAQDVWKQYAEGPRSVFRFDCRAYDMQEVLGDKKTNYCQPLETENGDLYYIAYPYRDPYVRRGLFGKKVPAPEVPCVHGIPEACVPVLFCKTGTKVREIRKGVFTYAVTGKGIYFADNRGLALLTPDGQEQRLAEMPRISYISVAGE